VLAEQISGIVALECLDSLTVNRIEVVEHLVGAVDLGDGLDSVVVRGVLSGVGGHALELRNGVGEVGAVWVDQVRNELTLYAVYEDEVRRETGDAGRRGVRNLQ